MYVIENGMRCDGTIHINRLAGCVFLLCGSEWWFIFLRLGWDEYKKVSVFFPPCFIVTPHIPLRSSGRVFCYLVPSSLPGGLPTTRISFLG